jgi:hypothetical protein
MIQLITIDALPIDRVAAINIQVEVARLDSRGCPLKDGSQLIHALRYPDARGYR